MHGGTVARTYQERRTAHYYFCSGAGDPWVARYVPSLSFCGGRRRALTRNKDNRSGTHSKLYISFHDAEHVRTHAVVRSSTRRGLRAACANSFASPSQLTSSKAQIQRRVQWRRGRRCMASAVRLIACHRPRLVCSVHRNVRACARRTIVVTAPRRRTASRIWTSLPRTARSSPSGTCVGNVCHLYTRTAVLIDYLGGQLTLTFCKRSTTQK